MPNPSEGSEWVSLHNPTDFDIDLTGTFIDDLIDGGRQPQELNQIIESQSILVIEITKYSRSYFNNGGDDVNFLDSDGNVIDSFTYTLTEKDVAIQI